jgi:hypothetical protein
VPVTYITGVPTKLIFDEAVTFNVQITPNNATKKAPIKWRVIMGYAWLNAVNDTVFDLRATNMPTLQLRATIAGAANNGAGDYTQDFNIQVNLPQTSGSGSGSGGGSGSGSGTGSSGTIRFVKENDGNSSMYAVWFYTMDSRYDKQFNNSQLATGNSGIDVNGAMSYFIPPAGLTLFQVERDLHNTLKNRGDYYEVDLPQGRYLVTWIKTSSAIHYGYDRQNWFVLDMPSHGGSPIEIKVDTTGPDCTMRF